MGRELELARLGGGGPLLFGSKSREQTVVPSLLGVGLFLKSEMVYQMLDPDLSSICLLFLPRFSIPPS